MKHNLFLFIALISNSMLFFGASELSEPKVVFNRVFKEDYFNAETGEFVLNDNIDPVGNTIELVHIRNQFTDPTFLQKIQPIRESIVQNPTTSIVMEPAILSIAYADPVLAENMLANFISECCVIRRAVVAVGVGEGYLRKGNTEDAKRVLRYAVSRYAAAAPLILLSQCCVKEHNIKGAEEWLCLLEQQGFTLSDINKERLEAASLAIQDKKKKQEGLLELNGEVRREDKSLKFIKSEDVS